MKVYFHTRPLYGFALGRDWQAHRGSDPVGPPRATSLEALADLPDAAGVFHDAFHSYSCAEPYRIAPVMSELYALVPPRGYREMGA